MRAALLRIQELLLGRKPELAHRSREPLHNQASLRSACCRFVYDNARSFPLAVLQAVDRRHPSPTDRKGMVAEAISAHLVVDVAQSLFVQTLFHAKSKSRNK